MTSPDPVLAAFEQHRPRLVALAVRMLGSTSAADDALQETWLRVSRARSDEITNMAGWLTTVTSRVCLNMLRNRQTRREDPFEFVVPDRESALSGPEDEADLADSVSFALLIVLDTLEPIERLVFVLHDLFAMPFDEIAPLVERTPAATRQLASRARRRVRSSSPTRQLPPAPGHRRIVDAFFAAARNGDLEGLLILLDPDLVLASDGGAGRPEATVTIAGAQMVAGRAMQFGRPGAVLHPVLVGARVGVLTTFDSQRYSLMAFTIDHGLITRIDALSDPDRLERLDAALDRDHA